MTQSNKAFFITIIIMGLVVCLTTAGSILFLYSTAVEEQKERLMEFVTTQSEFIEVFHEINSTHTDNMKIEAHLSHANELDEFFLKLSKSRLSSNQSKIKNPVLNFLIAEKKEEMVVFHIGNRKVLNETVPYDTLIGKPMGKALNGESGVLKTKDHLGNDILCSFIREPSTGMGIVAKILLKDLRRPFLKTALITYAAAFILFIFSGLIMKMMVSPLVKKVEKQHQKLKDLNKHLHQLATTDTLTELNNRMHFNEQLSYGVIVANRYKRDLSLILLDIDLFKKINDNLGHMTGDTVLKELSKFLTTQIRKSDILARWGGEEFAILIHEADKNETFKIAQKLCTSVSECDFDIDRRVTCSFGCTVYVLGESETDFMNRADKGLYEAKRKGRNQVVQI